VKLMQSKANNYGCTVTKGFISLKRYKEVQSYY
jgi:hypothetical protein